ncbi:MAG: hypothetical protein IPK67_15170 [Planctomycetes bacterium]|jgi:hypothetical protein|nr:hypothetical protein [Planctomycetota bacterium]
MAEQSPSEVPAGMHLCPTRVDAAPVLFAHTVTVPMCQQRQREHYHKCFTCAHNNALSSVRRVAPEVLARLEKPRRVGAG